MKIDALQAHSSVPLGWTTKATPFGFPVFVVWKTIVDPDGTTKRKARVVVDIRGLNKVSVKDSYLSPCRRTLFNPCGGRATS